MTLMIPTIAQGTVRFGTAAMLAFGVAADLFAQQDLALVDAVTRALAKNRDIAIERENIEHRRI